MVYGAIAQIVRPIIGKAARHIYTTLRQQDRLIDYTYRKTGLYNRGVVRGIKHGLIAGQIAGGTLQLGLNAPDSPGNDASVPFNGPSARTPYKTRNRRTGSSRKSNASICYPRRYKRRSSTRKY